MCGIFCAIKFDGKLDQLELNNCSSKIYPRGPDGQKTIIFDKYNNQIMMTFARLAIMDTSLIANQPFQDKTGKVICNGEIYNYQKLIKSYSIQMNTNCDCEIILPVADKIGFEQMIKSELDAEFAMIYYSKKDNAIYAARDRYGVRPLYYGRNNTTRTIYFSSELKALHPVAEIIFQVEPSVYYKISLNLEWNIALSGKKYYDYDKLINVTNYLTDTYYIQNKIREYFTEAVSKRLCSDRPIGFLLSGGLDSSLVVSIASKILGPEKIVCFSVGMNGSPDVESAKKVVSYLGIKNHHIIPFTVDIGIKNLENVISTIETYDITTIRASTPQYVMAKYISENTNIKVILSGEGSDEIHGSYKYMRFAPNEKEFHNETIRLLMELCYFDNLRTDRTTAGWGLEVRVPFLDHQYVEFISTISPKLFIYDKENIEKKIVRDSFRGYLPDDILYRPKEAFSDAVSTTDISWYQSVAKLADTIISDKEFENNIFLINKPQSKESLYYRKIFNKFYPNRDNVLPHYWLPKFPIGNTITDPSATILPN